jgi:hypothetical protein
MKRRGEGHNGQYILMEGVLAMPFWSKKTQETYGELNTVESGRNDLTAEEFPEGPYGSSIPELAMGKSSPWDYGQEVTSPYGYENVQLHQDLPRDYPGEDDQEVAIGEEDVR